MRKSKELKSREDFIQLTEPREFLEYSKAMLSNLQKMAARNNMTLFSRVLGLAVMEALLEIQHIDENMESPQGK